jgi:predicted enzyme related to lactoylglutathione lyase
MPAKKKSAAPRPAAPKLPRAAFVSVAIVVSDKERSLDWYTRNFGLDVIQKMDHWITVGRKGQDGVVHLCQTSDYDTSIPSESGNTGIQFQLPGDFPTACAALKANGVTFTNPPTKAEWGWWATVADPDGNEFSLTPAH